MADPQFEQFREVFERLPQHIKAPTYCYRLAHDIVLDSMMADDDEEADDVHQLEGDCSHKASSMDGAGTRDLAHFGSPVCWKETNWTDNSCKDNLPTLRWVVSSTTSPSLDQTTSANCNTLFQRKQQQQQFEDHAAIVPSSPSNSTALLNARKRRRLPEIPKDKPAIGSSSIVFKTQALSLAEEIFQAENNGDGVSVTSHPPQATNPAARNHVAITDDGVSSPKHSKHHQSSKRLLPFRIRSPRFTEDDSSPEEKILNTDIDSGNSTGHSPDYAAKRFSPAINGSCFSPCPMSPASSSGVSTTTLDSCLNSHRGLHRFIPRHHDEVEIDIGDPLYVQKEADDLWCEGINLRTGKCGIFPSAYVTDVEYTDFDPETVKVKKERFLLKFLGSVEVTCNKGNDVLCQAIRKITGTNEDGEMAWMPPHPCVLEISDQGLRMVDKSKPTPNNVPCHDYFFFLKNISFCGFHPNDYRYFGFITKHPTKQRFACHVFIGDDSTRPVAESVGRAFQRFYHKFIETAYPIEDIYLE